MNPERHNEPTGGAVQETEEPTDNPPTDPRGGTTTGSDLVNKNFWTPEMAEGLRRAAYEKRVSEADIMRRGLEPALEELE